MKKAPLVFLLLFVCILQGFSTAGKKQATLRLTDSTTVIFDETTIYLDLGSPQYLYPEDGQKVFDTSSSAPSFYSVSTDQVYCFSNSYGSLVAGTVVPLGFKVVSGGTFIISPQLLDNFDPTSIIRLEDRATGVFHDLRRGSYRFTLAQATTDNGRFYLHVSYPTSITGIDAGCANNDGSISIVQDGSIQWSSCILYDNNYTQLAVYNNITGSFAFNSLPFGSYNVVFIYGQYSTPIAVNVAGRSVTANASSSVVNATVGQPIQFFASAVNATDYVWDLGDGSQIAGVMNPTYSYTQTGTYNVSMRCSNVYGCSATSGITVNISAATGINNLTEDEITLAAQNRDLSVLVKKQIEADSKLELFNISGQLMLTQSIQLGQNNIDLAAAPAGVYIAHVTSGKQSLSKKVVLQ